MTESDYDYALRLQLMEDGVPESALTDLTRFRNLYQSPSTEFEREMEYIRSVRNGDSYELINTNRIVRPPQTQNETMMDSYLSLLSHMPINTPTIPIYFGAGTDGISTMSSLLSLINGIIGNHQEDVTVALTEDAVNKLPEINVETLKGNLEEFNENCTICLDAMNDKIILLPCKHYFHPECIKKWLREYNYKCPICRTESGDHETKP